MQACKLPKEIFSPEALEFFHRISIWVHNFKKTKGAILPWKKGLKKSKIISCIKAPKGQPLEDFVDKSLPANTLYVPNYCSGKYLFNHLRNAFCHNNIQYDKQTKQYELHSIGDDGTLKMCGRFSLDGIKFLVAAFLNETSKN